MSLFFLNDPSFWILISFILLLVSLSKYIFKNLNQQLKDRQDVIARQIKEVSALYEEARRLLLEEKENLKKKEQEIAETEKETLKEIERKKQDLKNTIQKMYQKLEEDLRQKMTVVEETRLNEITKNFLNKSCILAEAELTRSLSARSSASFIKSEIEKLKI